VETAGFFKVSRKAGLNQGDGLFGDKVGNDRNKAVAAQREQGQGKAVVAGKYPKGIGGIFAGT
jgi:hypothetical protein